MKTAHPGRATSPTRRLLGPETKVVSPNNDTLYVMGQCDVRQGPLVLHVPDTGDRYYVLQFVDAWTNNLASIGRRATGTAEAEYLLTDGEYDGPVPDGRTVVAAPTGVFSTPIDRYSIGGRTPGLRTGPDGSVTLYLQPIPRGGARRPTGCPPAGAFRPIMRMYQPRQPILDGSHVLPPVRRVQSEHR